MQGKLRVNSSYLSTDTGTTGVLDTDGDVAIVDVSDLTNISLYANQLTDDGNVTLTLEKSIDGTNWAPLGSALTQASFAAGANKAVEVSLSDSNGMPLRTKQIRATVSGKTGTGTYSILAVGSQVEGFR